MTAPAIHGKRPTFSASNVLECIARALSEIKAADKLTYADLGAVLGKSEDQAAKYCDGSATMDAVTLSRGKREWNGRFTGYLDRLCVDSRPSTGHSDQTALTHLLSAAGQLSHALEDGEITSEEVRTNRTALENARDAINAQLDKLLVAA